MDVAQLEQIGGLFVFVQAALTTPAIWRLYKDGKVVGMSLWTMSFYCFVSWYYVPIFFLVDMPWTGLGVVLLGLAELTWCVWAGTLIWRGRRA